MAEFTNTQLVEFANAQLRPAGNALAAIDIAINVVVAEYTARGLGTVIGDGGSTNLIADGSAVDGRTRRVGGDVYNFITLLQDLQAFFAVAGRRDVLMGWQTRGYGG